jgi:hypothetical protein
LPYFAKSVSVAILAAASLFSVRASAAHLTGTVMEDGTAVADLDGEIIAGDAKGFDDLLRSAMATGRNVVGLRLDSPGGLVGEAAVIARSVSIKGIDVAVLPGKECSSACFLIFAEGRQKYFSLSARIGVHGASIGGHETTGTEATTLTMARAISKLHVPPSVIAKMVTTPPTEMAWLTPEELISMGAFSDGPERNRPSATAGPPINKAISPTKYVLVFSNKNEIVLMDVNRIEETSASMRRAWTTTFPAPARRVAFKNAPTCICRLISTARKGVCNHSLLIFTDKITPTWREAYPPALGRPSFRRAPGMLSFVSYVLTLRCAPRQKLTPLPFETHQRKVIGRRTANTFCSGLLPIGTCWEHRGRMNAAFT